MKRVALLLMMVVVVALGARSGAQVRAEVALKAAIEQETVKGDLKAAIEAYRRIADGYPKNPTVRAQALLQMAGCYQKLGDAEAKRVYERILRDFAGESQIVAEARARLARLATAGMTPAPGALTIRQVADKAEPWSAVSRDGRYVTSTAWPSGDLILCDLASGTTRSLTKSAKPNGDFAEEAVFSPTGKQIAYAWLKHDTTPNRYDLRLISVNDPGGVAPKVLLDRQDVLWVGPYDWSADGNTLTVGILRADRSREIGLLSVSNGALRILKSLPQSREMGRVLFSPDGRFVAYEATSSEDRHRDIYVMGVDGNGDRAVVAHPSDDRLGAWTPDGRGLLFASDRAGSFGLYMTALSRENADAPARLIKGGMGPLSPIGLTTSGSFYYSAPSGGISDVHIANIDLSTGQLRSRPEPIADFMGANTGAVWSDDGKHLVHLRRPDAGGTVIVIRSHETNAVVRELRPKLQVVAYIRSAPDGRSLIVGGRNLEDRNGLFRIGVGTGDMSTIALNATGPVWSPDGNKLFYLLARDGASTLVEHDTVSGEQTVIARGPGLGFLQVSADGRKMYFRKAGTQAPEAEFVEKDLSSGVEKTIARGALGRLNLSPDAKWIATGAERQLVVRPVAGGEPRSVMRVEAPTRLSFAAWAPDSSAVIARKVVPAVTGAEAPNRAELWWIPLDGRASRMIHTYSITGDSGDAISVHPDGRRIAFSVAPDERKRWDVWAMDNVLPALSPRK